MSFTIKRNDTAPSYAVLLDTGVSLATATVKFIMTLKGETTPKVDAAALVIDGPTGSVRYDWVAGDTDEEGIYDAEWEITYANGRKQTLPDDDYLEVIVKADLG